MYIAEWLVTEYVDYADARSTLQTLFEELVWIGVVTLKNQLNVKWIKKKCWSQTCIL
jgi:hypothetical protein